jgi:hypothetical protein
MYRCNIYIYIQQGGGSYDRIGRAGDIQNGEFRTGHPEWDRQNRSSRTDQADQDIQNGTGRTGQTERGRHNRTGRTG